MKAMVVEIHNGSGHLHVARIAAARGAAGICYEAEK